MISKVLHFFEVLYAPERWKVKSAVVELNSGEKLEFENPEYYGHCIRRIIIMPENALKGQISIPISSVKKTKVKGY